MRRQNRAIYPVANSTSGLEHRGTENLSRSVARPLRKRSAEVSRLRPFGAAMTKITNRTVDKSFEIYLCLYQAVTGTEEEPNICKQFSPGFFDLVIIDECHRRRGADDATWRIERRNPRADFNNLAAMHPRGFRRSGRHKVTPVVPCACRGPPDEEAGAGVHRESALPGFRRIRKAVGAI